jgi:hypothetical protein
LDNFHPSQNGETNCLESKEKKTNNSRISSILSRYGFIQNKKLNSFTNILEIQKKFRDEKPKKKKPKITDFGQDGFNYYSPKFSI